MHLLFKVVFRLITSRFNISWCFWIDVEIWGLKRQEWSFTEIDFDCGSVLLLSHAWSGAAWGWMYPPQSVWQAEMMISVERSSDASDRNLAERQVIQISWGNVHADASCTSLRFIQWFSVDLCTVSDQTRTDLSLRLTWEESSWRHVVMYGTMKSIQQDLLACLNQLTLDADVLDLGI